MNRHVQEPDILVDESLHGLLIAYKEFNTYFRLYVDQEKRLLMLHLAENPRFFIKLNKESVQGFRVMKRVELNIRKLYVNYINPEQLLYNLGSTLGINFQFGQVDIKNFLKDTNRAYYSLVAPIRYVPDLIGVLQKVVAMSPQLKFEYVEKYLITSQS